MFTLASTLLASALLLLQTVAGSPNISPEIRLQAISVATTAISFAQAQLALNTEVKPTILSQKSVVLPTSTTQTPTKAPTVPESLSIIENEVAKITKTCQGVMSYPELRNSFRITSESRYYPAFVSEGVVLPLSDTYDLHPNCERYLTMSMEEQNVWVDKLDELNIKYDFKMPFLLATLIWEW